MKTWTQLQPRAQAMARRHYRHEVVTLVLDAVPWSCLSAYVTDAEEAKRLVSTLEALEQDGKLDEADQVLMAEHRETMQELIDYHCENALYPEEDDIIGPDVMMFDSEED